MRREFTIPTLLGVLVTVVGLAAGVVLLGNPLRNLVGASPDETPQNIKVTNISDSSLTISWTTVRATSGFVRYGENNPELVIADDRDQQNGNVGNYFTHHATIKGLRPATNYQFRLGSGGSLYGDSSSINQATTAPAPKNPPAAHVAYGQVVTPNGDPAEGAIVYIQLPGAVTQSALVKNSGAWVVPLATARTTDLANFAAYDRTAASVQLFVEGGPLGTSAVTLTTGDLSPARTISLGTATAAVLPTPTDIPPTPIPLPTTPPPIPTPTQSSKFTSSTQLELLSPKSKEGVSSQKPEIIGKAPPGSEIQIEVHSTANIKETIVADETGNFSYSVPKNLEPGPHTVTITTIIDGVVKKVSRSFVVKAAGTTNEPAFSASPSAKLKSTPTPTSPPRVAYPDTSEGTPAPGDLTSTLLLVILGVGLTLGGLIVYGRSTATKSI